MNELTSTQAFWLGHLFHASSRQLSLSEYADEQSLELADLLCWETHLTVQGIAVPPCHRPARFDDSNGQLKILTIALLTVESAGFSPANFGFMQRWRLISKFKICSKSGL